MALNTKSRRKITVGDRKFLYHGDEWDLRIYSEDKKFIIRLRTTFMPWKPKPDGFTPLEVIGRELPVLSRLKNERIWVKYPEIVNLYPPATIRRIIDWCLDPESIVEEIQDSDFISPDQSEPGANPSMD